MHPAQQSKAKSGLYEAGVAVRKVAERGWLTPIQVAALLRVPLRELPPVHSVDVNGRPRVYKNEVIRVLEDAEASTFNSLALQHIKGAKQNARVKRNPKAYQPDTTQS